MLQVDRSKLKFQTVFDIVVDSAAGLLPPERLSVSQAAAKYRILKNSGGGYEGPWLNETTPYMIDPMDCLTSRDFSAVVFMGPAQSGKSDALLLNWICYSVMCDPADMLIVEKSQAAAADFTRRRINPMHRHSPALKEKLIRRRDSDSVFNKAYSNGMLLTMAWPAINELSGRPVPRTAETDLDRMPEDIDGEGSVFDLAGKRNTTFGSFGMNLAESSPGHVVDDPKYMARTLHEAPPCKGIASLYNRGDRRRLYWPCPRCHDFFEGDFNLLAWPDTRDFVEAAEMAYMVCPKCEHQIQHARKYDLNLAGVWVPDGMRLDRDGFMFGNPMRSNIASFWLKGTAAAFATWKDLVLKHLQAEEEYERTGSQEALKTTVNTDQGHPYRMRGTEVERLPEDIKARAEPMGEHEVPEGVRFLVATCDVQKNQWVVQVFGVGIGMDLWLIDRFSIRKSVRKDEDGDTLWVKPATNLEDWDLLVEQVIEKTYPLADGSGRRMQMKLVGCDSGGRAGVTSNAYAFWQKLRDEERGHHKRFVLIKGDHVVGSPRTRISYVDSAMGKGQTAVNRGEVPVLLLNVNVLKDRVNAMLDRKEAHGGLIHFADWLPDEVYTELTVERRTSKGWENLKGYRNESWDLFTYCVGICTNLRLEQFDWSRPPRWADVWDKNDLVIAASSNQLKFEPSTKSGYDLAKLASQLA